MSSPHNEVSPHYKRVCIALIHYYRLDAAMECRNSVLTKNIYPRICVLRVILYCTRLFLTMPRKYKGSHKKCCGQHTRCGQDLYIDFFDIFITFYLNNLNYHKQTRDNDKQVTQTFII